MLTFKPKMRKTAGTVLVLNGRILLCKPTNGFGGYVWTFPKGGMDRFETPEQTAMRETLEESGYPCHLLKRIPGYYLSDKSACVYYIAVPTGKQRVYDRAETEATAWFTPQEAKVALSRSPNTAGRDRDLLVLREAGKLLGFTL